MARADGICFIDDELDELTRVKRSLGKHFTVGVGTDIDTALEDLGRRPRLFVLDMYYGPRTAASDRRRIAEKWRALSKEQDDFYDLLKDLGQSARGGRELASHVREKCPGVPIVFFTRKGSLEDADEAIRQGATAVLKKPDPKGVLADPGELVRALDEAMEKGEDQLARTLGHILDRQSWSMRHARLRGFMEGVAASLAAGLLLKIFL